MGWRARAVAALAVLAVAIAGCGSSKPPSALDPAKLAPSDALIYGEATVRPQGAQRDDVESALTKLLGHSPDAEIQRDIHPSGLNYQRDIQPWLGQRVGFVATSFSRSGIALILPSNDPAAAVAAMARAERRRGPLVAGSYAGVKYRVATGEHPQALFGAVGHYAVIGGAGAFRQIVDTYHGRAPSLPATVTGAVAWAYVNERRTVAAVMALPTIPPTARQQLRTVVGRAHLPTSVTLSLAISSHAFTADVRSSGAAGSAPSGGAADVSGLPGDSWLAISTGSSFAKQLTTGFNAGFLQGFSRAARASGVNPGAALQQFRRRTGIDLTRDLLPALGPFQFAVEGSSLATLQAALALYPTDPSAGARLIGDLHNLAARAHSLRVTGGARSFRFGPTSLPFPIVGVSDLGQRIVARFALGAAHPAASKLSANPTFIRARSQLPAGSAVPAFLDFGPLAALLSQTPQFKADGRDHKALAVLRRLDYFAVGTSAATHDTRVVLGLR
jgi:Protein of unknown function (DUF3352)